MPRRLMSVWVLLAAMALVGCNSYDKRFAEVAAQPVTPGDLAGAWKGKWTSETSGHTGDLRAIITKKETGEYHVDYHATYGETIKLSFEYGLDFKPEKRGETWYFGGEHDLGFPFGSYRYTGNATPAEFFATYDTKDDKGTYRMTRPAPDSR